MSDDTKKAGAGDPPVDFGQIRALHGRFERQDAINSGFAEVLAGFAAVLIENTGLSPKLFEEELERIATAWQGLGISPEAPIMVQLRLRRRLASPPDSNIGRPN